MGPGIGAPFRISLYRTRRGGKTDSYLFAYHVTAVTDAGGFASIRPAEKKEVFRENSRHSRRI